MLTQRALTTSADTRQARKEKGGRQRVCPATSKTRNIALWKYILQNAAILNNISFVFPIENICTTTSERLLKWRLQRHKGKRSIKQWNVLDHLRGGGGRELWKLWQGEWGAEEKEDMTYATLFPLTGARWAWQRREKEEKGDNFCTSVSSHFSRSHHIPCEQLSKYPKIILLHIKASINDTIKKCVQICRRFLNNLDPLLPLWTCFGFCSESSFAICTLNKVCYLKWLKTPQ